MRDDVRETVEELAGGCPECRVRAHELTHATATEYDLCDEHHRELIERRVDRTSVDGSDDDLSIGQDGRRVLASLGIDVDDGVTEADLADVDPGPVASMVAEDPTDDGAMEVLRHLANLDPERVAGETAAVEACLAVASEAGRGEGSAAGDVLAAVATVDRSVARRLIEAVADRDASYRLRSALRAAADRDREAILAVEDEDGRPLLARAVVARSRAGRETRFELALQVAREDAVAFRDAVDAFAAPLEAGDRDPQQAFFAAASVGRVAAVGGADDADEYRRILIDLAETEDVDPRHEARCRAAGAVAFAHAPELATRASVDRDWIRERLRPVLQRWPSPHPAPTAIWRLKSEMRAEAARALGRFVPAEDGPDPAGDRAFLEWVARVYDGRVETAARRALDGDFRVEWSTDRTAGGPEAATDSEGRDGNLQDGLADRFADASVPPSFVVGVAALEELGVEVDADAFQWDVEELQPLADLTAHHELGVVDLGSRVNPNSVVIGLGLEHIRYDPEQFPYPVYGYDSDRPTTFVTPDGLLVAPRVDDPEGARAAFRELVETLDAAELVGADDAEIRFASVGDLFEDG